MLVAPVLAITLDPGAAHAAHPPAALRLPAALAVPGRQRPAVGTVRQEERHPVNRFLMRLYAPVRLDPCGAVVVIGTGAAGRGRHRAGVLALGSEFMPPLEEGTLFYMPDDDARHLDLRGGRLVQVTDRNHRLLPGGGARPRQGGAAGTSTAPRAVSMSETVVPLKPKSAWRRVGHLVLRLGPEALSLCCPA